MGAGLKHDAQRIGAAEPAAERLRLGGKARLLDDLTGLVKNAHLDVAVAEIETHGHLRSLAGGSITHGSASFYGPAEPGSSWGPNGTPREAGLLIPSPYARRQCRRAKPTG